MYLLYFYNSVLASNRGLYLALSSTDLIYAQPTLRDSNRYLLHGISLATAIFNKHELSRL